MIHESVILNFMVDDCILYSKTIDTDINIIIIHRLTNTIYLFTFPAFLCFYYNANIILFLYDFNTHTVVYY